MRCPCCGSYPDEERRTECVMNEVERLRAAMTILAEAHEEIVRGLGLPEDISKDAILQAAAALGDKEDSA